MFQMKKIDDEPDNTNESVQGSVRNGATSGAVIDVDEITLQGTHPLEGAGRGYTRSGRKIKVSKKARESQYQRGKKWVAWIATALSGPELSPEDEIYEVFLLSRSMTFKTERRTQLRTQPLATLIQCTGTRQCRSEWPQQGLQSHH
jgi:hypothetical protein